MGTRSIGDAEDILSILNGVNRVNNGWVSHTSSIHDDADA